MPYAYLVWRPNYLGIDVGARALNLEGYLGNFLTSKEAGFVALDPQANPTLALRNPVGTVPDVKAVAEMAFVLMRRKPARVDRGKTEPMALEITISYQNREAIGLKA